ncbi:MAG TPA: acyltransferase [Candidatus Acidoferrales bacterium]|jgi:carbonic anhydrase/acetyltransferase-like protein (isoleucine patch superfamily)|nr:acyltransferase [Candidatus Acidoferrales bacterium]
MTIGFILKIKRAETPFYRWLKSSIKAFWAVEIPVFNLLVPLWKVVAWLRGIWSELWLRLCVVVYRGPLFRSACESVGKRLYLELLPNINGHTHIRIGDDVRISGALSIVSGRVLDHPELIVGNRVFLGHQVALCVSRGIVIEDDVLVAAQCYIADNDNHPTDMESRIQGMPPRPEGIRSVRICRGAWIGRCSHILKGVTIGEGAIVAAGSVVVKDVPPFTVVAGNPARVVKELER